VGRAYALGVRGERLAEQHLLGMGAQVLARNYRCVFGELDLVVEHEGDLVAVEVKTRTEGGLDHPEEALTWWKLKRIAQSLATYAMATNHPECGWRIDAVVVDVDLRGNVLRLEHIPNIYEG
jgi:putative endonuclease